MRSPLDVVALAHAGIQRGLGLAGRRNFDFRIRSDAGDERAFNSDDCHDLFPRLRFLERDATEATYRPAAR
jgi:hypothetical protein